MFHQCGKPHYGRNQAISIMLPNMEKTQTIVHICTYIM